MRKLLLIGGAGYVALLGAGVAVMFKLNREVMTPPPASTTVR